MQAALPAFLVARVVWRGQSRLGKNGFDGVVPMRGQAFSRWTQAVLGALGINKLWPYTSEWFESDAVDAQCAQDGLCPAAESLASHWHNTVTTVLAKATLAAPDYAGHQKGGKRGLHTEHLSHLLAPMQVLQRTHPGAVW